jgi:hypothetical protein
MRSARISFGVLALCAAALFAFGFARQGGTDRVVKRDGHSIYGHLDSVGATDVVIGGQSVPRAEVRYIVFSGASTPRPPKANDSQAQSGGPKADVVTLRDGRRTQGKVTRVTDRLVVQGTTRYERAKVAVIEFDADAGKVLPAEPSPSASPSPSPTPSPTPTPNQSATENGNDNSSTGGNPAGGGGGSVPPWLSKNPDKQSCPGGWGTIRVGGISCFKNCSVTIWVCGRAVKVLRWTPPGGPQNSDDVSDYLGLNAGNFVCCSRLRESKKNPVPCDGTKDLDCDGVPDDQDDYPTDPTRSKRPEKPKP